MAKDKLLPLWFEARVKRFLPHPESGLCYIDCLITNSNFIKSQVPFKIAAIKHPLRFVKEGHYIKITYFSFQKDIRKVQGNKIKFREKGVKYEVWDGSLWELVHEVFK